MAPAAAMMTPNHTRAVGFPIANPTLGGRYGEASVLVRPRLRESVLPMSSFRFFLVAVALSLTAACGDGSTGASSTTAAPVTTAATTTTAQVTTALTTTAPLTTAPASATTTIDAKTAIAANWEEFFSPSETVQQREALLENGASYEQALIQRSQDPRQATAKAKVKSVELTPPDRATVTYDVYLGDTVALPDAQGFAVLQDGVWKVSGESFCALMTLASTDPVPGCS